MDIPKEYDVCLIGLQYDHRVNLMNALKKNGISVFTGIGIVYAEYREAYNKARVALSWSSLRDTPCRVWEGFAMAIPSVVNRTPDLTTFFVENDHFLGFDTVEEGVQQVRKLLDNPEMAHEMADNAYRKVQTHHSWDARVTQILDTAKLII
jgi:spore maturation protein CgeB